MTDESLNNLLEIEHLGLTVDQSHHVDSNNRLQLCLRVQIVEYHVPHFTSAQLDDNPQTVLVRLIAKLGNTLDFLLFDQLGDSLEKPRLV